MRVFYLLATFILMLASITGGIYLVKNTQDNRNKAQSCWAECSCACGLNFCADATVPYGCSVQCDKACASTTPTSGSQLPSGTIECRKDHPNICPNTHSSNPAFDEMVGRYTGNESTCNFFDACGRTVSSSGSCNGLTRLSNGESYHGAFVGCNALGQNCFCPLDFTGNIQCYNDVNNDSCGARTIVAVSTSTPPTSTPIPTHTPTVTPKPTATGTIKPSLTPTLTNTPILTSTPGPSIPISPTNTPTNTPQNTPTFTTAPSPTNIIVTATLPSPTRIILPQSGIEFPIQILTVMGAIVTLTGFLILL